MSEEGTARGRNDRWFEKILSKEDWVYLLALLAPLFLYNVALKIVRIFGQTDAPGALMFLDQIRSDVFFGLGFAAFWICLFAAFRSGISRGVLLVFFHLSCMLLLVVTTASHFFYETTGSPLDYGLIVLTFENFNELSGVISSEATTVRLLLLSLVLMYGIAGPAVVTRLFFRDWHVPVRAAIREGLSGASIFGRRSAAMAVGVLTVALIFLSTLPSMTGTSNSFTRDTVVNLVITEVASAQIDEDRVAKKVEAEDLPTDAKLVETAQTEKKNVVVVFLESERASATTPYNPELDTTPVLEELSKDSLMAENAYAVVPHTSKSMTAAHCGMEPPLDTNMTESEPDGIPAQCLPDLLKEQGYSTAFFQSATENFERRRELVGNFGYDEFYPLETLPKEGFETVNYFGYEDDVMLEPSREWIEKQGDDPFLATYLTVTTHHDYNVPSDFPKKRYVEDDLYNDYLNTVAYQDRFLGKLIQQYKDAGLYDDTVFVVMADHGEGFGEHDLMQHDNTIYNEGIKIPFLIHDPSRFEGGTKIEKPVQNMDVLPTVAELLGFRIENDTYHGNSLLHPEDLPDKLRVSCWTENRCMSLIEGDQKYIYQFSNKAEEFYDLSEDPEEKNDIIDEKSEDEIRAMRYELLEWQALVRATYDKHLADVAKEEATTEETNPE